MSAESGWRAVLAKPTGHFRYEIGIFGGACSKGGACRARVLLGITNDPVLVDGAMVFPKIAEDDPRWPAECQKCFASVGVKFERTRSIAPMYGVESDPMIRALEDAPPGWMWNRDDLPEEWRGKDGMCLSMKLPDGADWLMDGPAQNCPDIAHHGHAGHGECGWTRLGIAPQITVTPSVSSPRFHGWLRDGVLKSI